MDMNTAVSLLNIKEDLLDDEVNGFDSIPITKDCNPVNSTRKTKPTRTKKNKTDLNTYERLLVSAVKELGYTANELTTWLNQIPNTPEGYIASKKRYFYGIRVQLLSTKEGIPVEFAFLPGEANDTRGIKALPFNIPSGSSIYADAG